MKKGSDKVSASSDRVSSSIESTPSTPALRRSKLRSKVNYGFAFALVLISLLGAFSWYVTLESTRAADRVWNSEKVLTALSLAHESLGDIDSDAQLFTLTGDPDLPARFERSSSAVSTALATLQERIIDPLQKQRLAVLKGLSSSALAACAAEIRAPHARHPSLRQATRSGCHAATETTRNTLLVMQERAHLLLGQRSEHAFAIQRLSLLLIVLGDLPGLLVLVGAWLIASREASRSAVSESQALTQNFLLGQRVESSDQALQSEIAIRKDTQTRLTTSEENYRVLLDGIRDYAVYMLDPEGYVASWNTGASRMFGYLPHQIIGKHFSCFYTAAERSQNRPQEALSEALFAGRCEAEGYRTRIDGSQFWADVVITPLTSDDAGTRGFAKVVRDATFRKQAETALTESEARLSGIIQSAMDGIVTIDEDQRIVLFNNAAEIIFGYSRSQVLGVPLNHLIPSRFHSLHGGQIDRFKETGVTNRIMGQSQPLWATRADGSEFQIEAAISQVIVAGKKLFTVILRDVTERIKAQEEREHFAAVIESSDDAIISKDLHGIIRAWNRGAEAVFGYTRAEAIGRPVLMLFPPEHIQDEKEIVTRILRGEKIEHFETERIRKDGTRIDVSVSVSPIRDRSGKIIGASKIARDVTDRKATEEAKRQSDARRRFAMESANLGDWEFDPVTLEARRSLQHAQIFGYENADSPWNLKLFFEHVHPDDRVSVSKVLDRGVRDGKRWDCECRIIRPSGEMRWIRICGKSYLPDRHNSPRVYGILEDITERKEVEAALQQSEEKLRLTVEGAKAGTWYRNLLTGEVQWSAMSLTLFGVSESTAPSAENFRSLVHPDDRYRVAEAIQSAIDGAATCEIEYRVVWPDGSIHWLIARGKVYADESGRPTHIAGIVLDITEKHRAAEKLERQRDELERQADALLRSQQALESQTLLLESVLNSMQEGIVVVDEFGRSILWNPEAGKITGVPRLDIPQSEWRRYYDVFLLDGVSPFPDEDLPLQRALLGQSTRVEMYIRSRSVADHGRWVEAVGAPLVDKQGQLRGGMVAFRDTTEKKVADIEIRKLNESLEERIAQRTAELEATNRELEAFTYSVSHDLRAPLRHVQGFVSACIEELGDMASKEARHYLDRIQHGTRRMGDLLNELLELSRMSRQKLHVELTDLDPVVSEIITMLASDVNGRDVAWRVEELPRENCDPVLVRQIFQNLISNAIKYSGKRQQAVIEVGSRPEAGHNIFFVRDNGVGFNMQYADKLFGIFQRLHREDEFEGTGVGLATVHRIVEKHGGKIWADAAVDRGATFYFTLSASS